MHPCLTELSSVMRPRLLVKAARLAQSGYRRETQLPRLIGPLDMIGDQHIAPRLSALEEALNEKRKTRDASYSITRHVSVLAALISEAARAARPA